MTYLILMLAVAAAMIWSRESLGRALVRAAGSVNWRWVVIVAILAFAVWGLLQHLQAPVVVTGDAVTGLFDTFAYGDLFVTYIDLIVGVAVAVLNRRTRQMVGRLIDLARPTGLLMLRRVGRARRATVRPRRRPPDGDDPEPGAFGDLPALA